MKKQRLFRILLQWALVVACLPLLMAQDGDLFPPKPEPAVFVNDYANWLTPHEKSILESKLRAYYDSTSTQIVVMIRSDLGDYDKGSYAIELGNRWGIGKKSKNNGLVMLIKTVPPDRGVFIATGYGTEARLPDGKCGEIIRTVIAPYFRSEQYYKGIDSGLDELISNLEGEFTADAEPGDAVAGYVVLFVFLLILLFILFLIYRFKNGSKTIYTQDGRSLRRTQRDDTWWNSGGGWTGGSSGGGWSGGGGSSGGGWSGGFGGGSFGGGGAGGDW